MKMNTKLMLQGILLGIIFNFCFLFSSKAQVISGVINTYTKVNSVTNCSCPTTNCAQISAVSNLGLAAGDRILIIQMKGALANTSNTESHGNVASLNDAGNYEFATVASVSGTTITTTLPLKETYFTGITPTDSAAVQLIKVPIYPGPVTVSGTLTAQAWNGTTGGVLAFETAGNVTLNANINVDGLGFRKAKRILNAESCTTDTAFYYQSTGWQTSANAIYIYDESRMADDGGGPAPGLTPNMYGTDNRKGAYRGEGIAHLHFRKVFGNGNIAYFDKGKAKWANGGGGGQSHNSGGGGGANAGGGGFGGKNFNSGTCDYASYGFNWDSRRGRGGQAQTATASKIFMGGGGGEGHDNGGNGSTGTNGGGIIFVKAASIINGGAFTISANGIDNTVIASGDGSGGGGAGGSIVLDVPTFTNAITISAKGGKGGDHVNNNCHGTGGGGGGGLIWYLSSCTPTNVTSVVTGGLNGTQTGATIDCGADRNWGATPGGVGLVRCGLGSGASVFLNTSSCSLPADLLGFSGSVKGEYVVLNWSASNEINVNHYEIERSLDALNFESIGNVNPMSSFASLGKYTYRDFEIIRNNLSFAYYRLKIVDQNGKVNYSNVISISNQQDFMVNYYPNPVALDGVLRVNLIHAQEMATIVIRDVFGKEVVTYENIQTNGVVEIPIAREKFMSGPYFIQINIGSENQLVRKFFVD